MTGRDVWAVEVRYDDENPGTYGPYTQAQAERVAARIQGEVDLASAAHGENLHPRGVLGAIAFSLTRYDSFMKAAERNQARRDVRAADREVADRIAEEGS